MGDKPIPHVLRVCDMQPGDVFNDNGDLFTVLAAFDGERMVLDTFHHQTRSRVRRREAGDDWYDPRPWRLTEAQRMTLRDALAGKLHYRRPRDWNPAEMVGCQFFSTALDRPNRPTAGFRTGVRVTQSAIALADAGFLDVTDWNSSSGKPFVTKVGEVIAKREGLL